MSEKNTNVTPLQPGKKKTGRPPKHGSRLLQQLIHNNQLDERTATARLLRQVERDLAEDAGGEAALSNRERLLIQRSAALVVICSSIENYVFKQDSLLDDNGELLGVLRNGQFLAFQNTLRLNLLGLGLKPERPKSEPDLGEYIKQKGQETHT